MLHEDNSCVQNSVAVRDWATPVDTPNSYRMIIHSNRRPSAEHVSRYSRPQSSESAAIISGAEDGIVGRQNIGICLRVQLTHNGAERFSTVPNTHRPNDPLLCILLGPYDMDGWYPGLTLSNVPS